ncbi:type VI secretion system protein TssA [Aquabacterium sp.]|uniref:type VI secretion system protein TssA n=1 Tax=Aquabacterium sp. TaxID=1872578 RepID=UPI0035AEA199
MHADLTTPDTGFAADPTLAPLLAPVSDAAPCGDDLSYSVEFDALARLREADDPSLDQGEWVTPLKVADWPGVARGAARLLTERSKDLRLAGWLTEAWACTDGYRGLARGLRLTSGLAQRYWPHLHPLPEGGDQEERVGTVAWLLARVREQARRLPAVCGKGANYSLAEVAQVRASSASATPATDPRLQADRLTRALREMSSASWAEQVGAAREAVQALGDLQQVIDQHLGEHGPSFVPAREALAEAAADLERLARDSGAWVGGAAQASPAKGEAAADRAAAGAVESSQGGAGGAGPIASRAQALQRLQEVADFFRRTEPHSPVAYLADKAVQWGNMPLHEWLRVVLKDAGSLSHVEELLGVPAAGGDAG